MYLRGLLLRGGSGRGGRGRGMKGKGIERGEEVEGGICHTPKFRNGAPHV